MTPIHIDAKKKLYALHYFFFEEEEDEEEEKKKDIFFDKNYFLRISFHKVFI